jgi:hypothetical protein
VLSLTRLLTRRLATHSPALALISTAAVSGALALAAPAGALVTEVGPTSVGLQPRNVSTVLDGNGELGASFANPSGHPVLHAENTYAIYWDPTAHYHGDWQGLIDSFLQRVGADGGSLGNIFAVTAQYTDRSNTPATDRATFRGAYTDIHKYPVSGNCVDPAPLELGDAITCLTDAQLREELQSFIAQHGLQKGMGSIFYLLTPPGVTVCVDSAATRCSSYTRSKAEETEHKYESSSYLESFCSYHAAINPGNLTTGDGNTVLYAAIPWSAGGLGDYHLLPADQQPGFECQDGGFDPTSSPIEQKEKEPHQQEPNQVGLGPDGSFDTGLADLIVNQIAVEQQNMTSNPLLNAWQDSAHNEATDECRNFFASGSVVGGVDPGEGTKAGKLSNQTLNGGIYYLNTAFNLAAAMLPYPSVPCLGGVTLAPKFTSPNPVNVGDVVGFDGMESVVSLNAAYGYSAAGAPQPNYATYTWNFGDGTPTVSGYAPGAPACEAPWLSPCAASSFHSYQYGGSYNVSLTVTDVAGNSATVTNLVLVNGPPPPAPAKEAPSGSPGASVAGGAAQAPGSSPSGASPSLPRPVAVAAILSPSLRGALRSGLPVRYSVNQQVAGRFEVLLARSLARRLGIGGAPAVDLPAGSSPAVVIAKAILVTTRAGRNTLRIQFSKATAAHLARLRKVTLNLRMVVHNSDPHAPATTTVLSTVTLSH